MSAIFIAGTGAFSLFWTDEILRESAEMEATYRLIWIPLYGLIGIVALIEYRRVARVLLLDKFILAIVILAVVSVSWSDDPGVTLRRALALVASTLAGAYFAATFRLDQQLRLKAVLLLGVGIASILFVYLLPDYGISFEGAWRGIFSHKNMLGRYLMIGSLVWWFLPVHRSWRWGVLIGFAMLLVASQSVTPFAVLVAVAVLLPLFKSMRLGGLWKVSAVWLFLTIGVAISIWGPELTETALANVGRDVTLSGRVELWEMVTLSIREAPWLGHGYGAFWTGSGSAADLGSLLGWKMNHAHNGYMDVLLDLGAAGLLLVVISILRNMRESLFLMRQVQAPMAMWPIAFYTALIFYNIAESATIQQNSAIWFIYVATSLSLRETTRLWRVHLTTSRRISSTTRRPPIQDPRPRRASSIQRRPDDDGSGTPSTTTIG